MPRYLTRFYGKKRGRRHTGSNVVRSFGSGCFCAVSLGIGLAALFYFFAALTVPELRVNRDFVEHRARLIDKRLEEQPARDGPLYAPRFRLQFTVQGRRFSPWAPYDVTDLHTRDRHRSEQLLAEFQTGQDYACWYDPQNPERVVLARGYSWFAWLMLVVPVPFIAVGAGGLSFLIWSWGKSAERRAVLAQETARREQIELTGQEPPFPSVPSPGDVTDSPGTTLAFRLPSGEPGWNLAGLLLLSIVWNGVVAAFLWMAVDGYRRGSPDWLLALLVAPLAVGGAGLVALFLRQLLVAGSVGPTIVEISEHPLYPGGTFELFIDQSGKLTVKRLRVVLVCEEEATYRQGTDARTATRRVYEHEIYCREASPEPHEPGLRLRTSMEIPACAMHSFRSEHNKVCWKLVVSGEVARRGDFERSFLLHVYPCRFESHAA
ncbi:MAG TPA: DUF3592 domain-containing protein [Pirellulales bacterium]|nr:DUF3592 domain-containing protein [Pirellulales bacterium]